MRTQELMDRVCRERAYFGKEGGVTVSGGEPLLQAKGIMEFFFRLRKEKINTALDTNGSILTHEVKKTLALTDLVLLDVKHIDEKGHLSLTKHSNKQTLGFAQYLEKQAIPFWLRYVLVPGYNDEPKLLHRYGKYFEKYKSIKRVEILPYHTLGVYKYEALGLKYSLSNVEPPSAEKVNEAVTLFKKYFEQVLVR